MASRLLHRLRHALASDSPGEAATGPEAEQFPESSELEDDDAEGLSSRLSGTLSFTSAEDEEDDDDEEDEDEAHPDSLPPGDGTSGEDAERSPLPDGQRGSQLLARQLQDFWKKSRNTLVPQRLLFEVTSTSVVKDPPSKYVDWSYSSVQSLQVLSHVWWYTPVIPALGRLRQENHCKFETSLGYKASSKST